MSHSFTSLFYPIVFATEMRLPMLTRGLIPKVRRYIAGIVAHHRGRLITANGDRDHLHCLTSLHQSMSVADAARIIKSNSSPWLSKQAGLKTFSWQDGYAGFTVSRSQVERVRRYIDQQEEHHRKRSFRDELRALFEAHGLEPPNDLFDTGHG